MFIFFKSSVADVIDLHQSDPSLIPVSHPEVIGGISQCLWLNAPSECHHHHLTPSDITSKHTILPRHNFHTT